MCALLLDCRSIYRAVINAGIKTASIRGNKVTLCDYVKEMRKMALFKSVARLGIGGLCTLDAAEMISLRQHVRLALAQ